MDKSLKIKALILDMDGVIIDSEPLHKQVEQDIFKELGISVPHEEHIKFAGVGKEMWTILKDKYHYTSNFTEEELHELKRERYLKQLTSKAIKPIKGIPELVDTCKSLGIKVAIASSSSRQNILVVSKAVGIFDKIDTIVSGDEVPHTKPSPDIFLKTAQELGVDTSKCVVLEDSENGVKASKSANIFCIGFQNPNSGNQDLHLADKIIKHINEVEALITAAIAV